MSSTTPAGPLSDENGPLGPHPQRRVQARPVFLILRLLIVIFFCFSLRLISLPQSLSSCQFQYNMGEKFLFLSPFSAPTPG